jgi:predicted acylesterase/phospholipase RssA/CRP-like cAMP-binding protein
VTDRASSFEGILVPIQALARAPLFAGLEPAALAEVAHAMRFRSFPAGEVICREGEPGESMFLIVDGLVQARVSALDARALSMFAEDRLAGKLRQGDAIGATSLITGEPRSATIVASTPTDVLELGSDAFRGLIARFPRLLENLVKILAGRLGEASSRQARGSRGEAVALFAPDPEPIVAAAKAASTKPVTAIAGDVESLGALDRLLGDHGTVILLGDAENAALLVEHTDRAVDVADFPGRDSAWLGRHITRTKLGLALGAGGAKGYAHVGALYELEAAGYTVDYVGGSSIGAIVGACIAMGLDARATHEALDRAFTPENIAEMFRMTLGGGGGLETMVAVLQEAVGERTFDDLLLPLIVMTVSLTDRAPAPLTRGPVWEALVAATALAGMFPPYEKDGHRLVDGLALVPVPTQAVREAGADIVVAVNLMARETLRAWPGHEHDPEPEQPARKRYRMLDTLLEVMDLAQLDTSVRDAAAADVTLTPRFGPGAWRDFELADRFLEAGRVAARRELPSLRALTPGVPR